MNMRCGYKVALGTGFEALMSHLLEFHGEEISLQDEPKYYSWREFDSVLSLSGRGHKEKNIIETLIGYNYDVIFEHLLESIGFVS